MWLTTEELDEIQDVRAVDIERILAADAFGKFVILSASEHSFIQAGNDWQPSEECKTFLQEYDSDPWVLEYRDVEHAQQFRAVGNVTLEQVKQAFLLYLGGEHEWLTMFEWQELNI